MEPTSMPALGTRWRMPAAPVTAWRPRGAPQAAIPRAEPTCSQHADLQISGKSVRLCAGERVYTEGDKVIALFMVQSGAVRACRHGRDGRRQIDAFYREGDMIGLENGACYSHSAEALCDTIVAPHPPYGAGTTPDGDGVSRAVLAHAMAALARAQAHVVLLGHRTAGAKLSVFLLDWAGALSAPGKVTLPMPRHDIADYLGITAETVSRELHEMQRQGLVKLLSSRQILLADPAGLRRLCAASGRL